jgi:hypothetical protein
MLVECLMCLCLGILIGIGMCWWATCDCDEECETCVKRDRLEDDELDALLDAYGK